ncbi:component of IIS longevity pathway SMK-1-domain-containing protein [Amylocystis lapponica]|nr:component of IIS longevity pathway SMK-1-domain-containing protein [Amylocystis lapponica]
MSSVHAAGALTETVAPSTASPQPQPIAPAAPGPSSPVRDADQPSMPAKQEGRVDDLEKTVELTSQPGDVAAGAPGAADQVEGAEQDQVVVSGDDGGQWSDDDSHELKRVKVYELVGSRWLDQGTAFCFGDFQDNEALLIARAEADFNNVILSTTIRSNDVYQRQQDTLIVWTEPDGVDYALSFQDPEGCAEVWHFIQEVQRHMNTTDDILSSSPIMGSDHSTTTASIIRSGHLPRPQLGIMGEIERAIKTLARTNALKERICEYIQTEDYIKAMVEVMTQAEDLESLENLHALCSCMQAILLLNDHSLYEHILEDDLFFGVVGMLEYDPEFPAHKANYREFLHQSSRFHQPIPLQDAAIQRKVHHTYRLQFLKDVVLARAIDDSTFNVLNSCIIFNQIDIINHVQTDPAFLREVVGMFMDEELLVSLGLAPKGKEPARKDAEKMDVDPADPKADGTAAPSRTGESSSSSAKPSDEELQRRREVVYLIQQLCVMGKNVQLPARMTLFRTLVDRGILFAVQWAFGQPETDAEGLQMIAAAGEILTTLLDHDLNGVRGHVLKQLSAMDTQKANGKKIVERDTVLALMCKLLVRSRDLAVQSEVGETLKTLLEIQPDIPEQHVSTPLLWRMFGALIVPSQPTAGVKLLQRAKDDPGVEKFLDYFYKQCIETLFRPFGDIPEFRNLTETSLTLSRERTNLYLYLCDLLSTFALQHSFRSHFFILSSNISPRVASLLSARDKHLRLAAFRFFRTCLKLNNGNIFKHMIKHDVLKPILDLTVQESRRDNLLSASCQEYFEFMRRENMKDVINHCMTKHEAQIRGLSESPLGGPRFQALIRRWEMNVEPPPAGEEEKIEKPVPNGARRWGQGRLLEAEEEDYFNADDDDDEILPVVSTPPPRGHTLKRKRARGLGIPVRSVRPYAALPRTPALGSLVDYDEGDDLGGLGPVESTNPLSSPALNRAASSGYFPLASASDVPASPRIAHRQIPPKPVSDSEPQDEQDDLLETLFTNKSGPSSPSSIARPPSPSQGSKRRRDDDDDELLERLASRAKRPSVGPTLEKENSDSPVAGKAGVAKSAEEGPKKIKLKFGAVGAAVASSPATPAPPDTGTKDGDNG